MNLNELAKHIRDEVDYRLSIRDQSPTITITIPVESAGEIAAALERNNVTVNHSDERRRLLCDWLYHCGKNSHKLTGQQHLHAFALGDGYGKQTEQWLVEQELTYDWSHIRDSSDEAQIAIEKYLRSIGCE